MTYRNDPPEMHELIGRRIERIQLAEPADDSYEESVLIFQTDAGRLGYYAQGDCCSYSWFNDIIGVDALLGGTVRSVADINLHDLSDDDDGDYVQFYGIKIATDRGVADIVYRNRSNGYYGGSCERLNEEYDKWPTEGLVDITADWSADA